MLMNENNSQSIPVLIQLGPELGLISDSWRPFARKLAWQVSSDLTLLLSDLGIPGKAEVEIQTINSPHNLRVFVAGTEVRFSLTLVQRIHDYFSPTGVNAPTLDTHWGPQVVQLIAEDNQAAFFSTLIVEAIKEDLGVLLGDAQTAAYLKFGEASIAGVSKLDPERVQYILWVLLKLKLSLKDPYRVLKLIEEWLRDRRPHEVAEELVTRLCPGKIQIAINPDYLKEIAKAPSADKLEFDAQVKQRLQMLSDGLFFELGIRLPDIEVITSPTIRDAAFTIKINHVTSAPFPALPAGQLLVNDTVERLKAIGVEGSRALNPANGNECSVVSSADFGKVSNDKLWIWTPFEFIVLSASAELRRNAWRLLHLEAVEHELAMLHAAFPDLVMATLTNTSLPLVTQIARALIREEVSIRDLRAILERILSYDYTVADAREFIIFDDRLTFSIEPPPKEDHHPQHYAQYVRLGLKQYLTHKLSRGQNTLHVFMLTQELEKQLIDHMAAEQGRPGTARLTTDDHEAILTAARSEFDNTTQAGAPIILTISEIRSLIRELLAPEFPAVSVVAYDELRPDSNIQRIGTISLAAQATS